MGLGPSLSIRQSQQLVLTPQLRQAIQLLQLSNLELEAFLAEELSKNPLLESRGEDDAEPGAAHDSAGEDIETDEPGDDPGADDIITGQAEDDRPLDVDWTAEALETDSLSDVVTSGSGEEAFDFDRIQYAPASLAEHLIDQLHGLSGDVGDLARVIAETLDETGYLTVSLDQIADLTGAPLPLVDRALAAVQGLDPPGVGARSLAGAASLGISAIIASVVMRRPATDAASCNAVRTTFTGSMMPAFTRSANSFFWAS